MNTFFKSLYAFGLSSFLATSLAYGDIHSKGLAHCGGLFLLDSESAELNAAHCSVGDTVQFGAHSVFADIGYGHASGIWKDGWTLSLKRDALQASAGFRSDFKNISLSVIANNEPAIMSSLAFDIADSSFFAGTLFGGGNPTLATVRWESENESDQVHEIEGDWVSDYIRKGFIVGTSFKGNMLQTSFEMFRSTPEKQKEEYFIKDSSQINIWDSRYRHDFGNSALDVQYLQASAKSEIIGNTYRDGSTKRFMYLPLKALAHYGSIHWGNETYGVDTRGILAYGKLSKNKKRFFETLAPNRLLPASVTQALSFSFLQMNYLVDADLNIGLATFGGYFNPHFDISGRTRIIPKFGLYGYYTYDDIEIEKTSETTSFIGYNSETEWWFWSLESTGLIASIGISLDNMSQDKSRVLSLEWGASQIVPLKTDIRKKADSPSSGKTSTKNPEGTSPSGIFKNGFATRVITTLRF